MKKLLLVSAGFAFALSMLWAGVVTAANVRSGQAPRIMSNEVIDGTLYSAGGDIKMEGTVQGDLMCAGQNIEITGTVEGDVLCAGQNVTVSGTVLGDVRVAGQVVAVKGKVSGSTSVIGQNVTIDSAATIARDLTVAGQQLSVHGAVGRDVEALGSSFTTSAQIGRDLDVTAPAIALSNGTNIAGMFMYVSRDDASVDSGAKITGKTEHKQPPAGQSDGPRLMSPAAYVSSVVFSFGSFLMLGLALLLAAPRMVRAATSAIANAPLSTLGAGFFALFLPPITAVLLLVTIIGIPLGVVILLGWIASLLLGLVFSAQVIGSKVVVRLGLTDPWHHYASLIVGLFVVFLVALLPFIGPLIVFITVVWGAGGLYYAAFKRRGLTPVTEVKETKTRA